jgi:hypothetical protein
VDIGAAWRRRSAAALGDVNTTAGAAIGTDQHVDSGRLVLARGQRLKRCFKDVGQGDPAVAKLGFGAAQPTGQGVVGGQYPAGLVAQEQPDRRVVGKADGGVIGRPAIIAILIVTKESAQQTRRTWARIDTTVHFLPRHDMRRGGFRPECPIRRQS